MEPWFVTTGLPLVWPSVSNPYAPSAYNRVGPVYYRPVPMPKRSALPTLSKLSRPRLFGAVARERLFCILDAARDLHPGICVVGPPGAGKTTLVASWLETRRRGGIWYQVDAGDADLATFFHYLGLAAQPCVRRGQRPLPALTPEYLADVKGFSRRFFRDLFARLPARFALVLDNYQEVDADNTFHELVSEAIDEVPPGSHLIVVSRADPPTCYARLRANRAVVTIDWDALRLTLDEALAIGHQQRATDDDAVRSLHERCDGWAAGLILMLAEKSPVTSAATPFGAAPEAVFDYFAGTLFDRAPNALRRMLLSVAFLPYVRADWATTLTGDDEAAKQLDLLYRRHFFTQRRPGAEGSYQFHALFQGFLRSRARRQLAETDFEDLLRRSAQLLREAREIEAAFDLDCELANWDSAADLLLGEAEPMIAAGRWRTFAQCVSRLPGAQLDAKPWLAYWLGISLTPVDQERARRVLEGAYFEFERRKNRLGQMLSAAGALDAIALALQDLTLSLRWIDMLATLLASNPDFESETIELRVLSSLLTPGVEAWPNHSALPGLAQRVTHLIERCHDANLCVWAAIGVITYGKSSSALEVAQRVADRALEIVDSGSVTPANAARFHGALGYLHYIKNDFPAALQAYSCSRALAREHGLVDQAFIVATWRGFCEWRSGYADDLKATIQELERIPVRDRPNYDALYLLLKAAAAAGGGHHADAIGIGTRAVKRAEVSGGRILACIGRTIVLDWMFRCRGPEDIAIELDKLETAIAANQITVCLQLPALANRFYLCLLNGERDLAHAFAVRTLEQARPFGIVVYLRWAETAMPHLCAYALTNDIHVDFVRQLIDAYRLRPPTPDLEHWPWRIKVRVLGTFDLAMGEQPPAFTRKAPKRLLQLLKALIAFGAADVPAQKLADALWPEEEGDAGMHSLQVAITRLRKLLGAADAVQVQDGSISLNRDLCWVDALAFDRLLANGADGIDLAERACSLYQGAFLANETEAPWAVPARERLRSRYVEQVDRIGRHFEVASQWDRAASWYQRGIDADPLIESFHQGVIRCYAQSGRRAEALSAYRRLRQTLSVVLGIHPSATTQALYDTLYAA